jgi:uncharacterized Zn-finger protein
MPSKVEKIEVQQSPPIQQPGSDMIEKPKKMEYVYDELKDEYICPDCGITKKKQNTMHYHMKRCQNILDFVCTECQQEFVQKNALDTHMRLRHPPVNKDDTEEFVCPFEGCDFTNPTKGNCRTHCMRKHLKKEVANIMEVTPDKQVKCKTCAVTFKSKPHFYYHSLGCIVLPLTDPRHEILKDII